jgi:NSS family neurotransmitter:Na+ symporter
VFFVLVFFAAVTSQVSIMQVPLSALQDELKLTRGKSVLTLMIITSGLVLMCTMSFGMVDFFTQFIEYNGQVKSFFDLNVDVFNDTVLPLNGFLICVFVIFRWKKVNFEQEAFGGQTQGAITLTQRYVNFALKTYVPLILLLIFVNTALYKFLGIHLI